MTNMKAAITAAIFGAAVANAVAIYGQCGGIGYTGSTTCDSGLVCEVINPYYFQCLTYTAGVTTTGAGTGAATTSTATKTSTATSASSSSTGLTCSGTKTKFSYFGVSESCAEWGTAIPGTLGVDYTWPSPSSVDFFVAKGMTSFRIPFMIERLAPLATGLTGAFDATYLSGLTTIVNYITTTKGGYAIIDPHNYMRYNNVIITSTSDFQTFWKNLATQFKSNTKVIFDVMNEPNGIDATTVAALNQAAINGIRAAGATSQLILVEGTQWTGAWTWTSSGNAAAFTSLTDPNNNFAFEMHQYLDSDGSGSDPSCVSTTIGSERLADATAWLKQYNFKGFIGEVGTGNSTTCIDAVFDMLCYMQEQGGTWIGALWWAAGPWWGQLTELSIEPPSGDAVAAVLPQALLPFV
ncbi:glycoside hydrolase [Clavulina sp. PMI_390]|nr:glycoside hydrolase [Clavulina sp. PMI_390]